MGKSEKARPIINYALIILGNVLYALSVAMFTKPASIPLGGVAGIALVINYLTRWPMGVMVIVLNLPLFLVSFRSLGRSFLVRTIVSTVVSSVLIDVFGNLLKGYTLTQEPILVALYGGLLSGAGLGLVFAQGATTGGTDIISKMINRKRPHFSIGKINLAISATIIIISSIIFKSYEAALYAMIVQYVSASVIDGIISGLDHASAAMVITRDPERISGAILGKMHRGCTGFLSKGMYTKSDQTTLLVAVRNHEVSELKRVVLGEDKDAFIILLNAREVMGRGFKSYGQ